MVGVRRSANHGFLVETVWKTSASDGAFWLMYKNDGGACKESQ